MELETVKELIEIMKNNDLSELEIADGQTRIALKRISEQSPPQVVAMTPALAVNGTVPVAPDTTAKPAPTETTTEQAQDEEKLDQIVAPMVGTFYTTPSPNAEPFVEVGSKVDNDTVIGIIEAMKVMNEIKSDFNGTVKKVLAGNGVAVEYGQPLFLVEPD